MKRLIAILLYLGSSFSQDYPDFEIIQLNDPQPSPMFIHTMSEQNRFMGIIDQDLNIQWHVRSNFMGLDFKVNQDLLSYYYKAGGAWILVNDVMREIDTLSCNGPYIADYHDIQILDNGSYILQAYDSMFVDMSEIIEGGQPVAWITGILIIQMFNAGHELIFEWNAWEHLNIANYTNLNLVNNAIEWMHGNSIEVYDNQILVSNRASNEILKLNIESGEIIWHLGGPLNEFTFLNDPKQGFKMQHDVRILENGNITLFDNGVTHSTPISRAVEYDVNENEKIAELVWEYIHPDSIIGLAMGSVQRLPNGNTLINWGSINNSGAIITEVTNDKNIAFEIRFPNPYKIYKARKHDWMFSVSLLNGDANLDNIVDIMDINHIVDAFDEMSPYLDLYHLYRLDTNKDGEIDVGDVDLVIEQLLYQNN